MSFALLNTVVLERDLPEHGLRRGDLGAVVERSFLQRCFTNPTDSTYSSCRHLARPKLWSR